VSAHGNPPAVLTYPGLAESQILPTSASNFKFRALTAAPPLPTGLSIVSNNWVLGITKLTAGPTNFVETSPDLKQWQTLSNFIPASAAMNLQVGAVTGTNAFFRLRVAP
jgi:hypothetical protein